MTTAHRPTWVAAQAAASDVGNWSTGGQASQAVSSWDLPSQTKLKFRRTGQNSEAELRKRDVRAEVEESERRALDDKPVTIGRRYDEGGASRGRDRLQLLLKEQDEVNLEDVKKYDDADDADSGDDLDSSDSDSDSDDEEALEKELEKIRKEREEARKKKAWIHLPTAKLLIILCKEAEVEEKRKQEAAMTGNVLLAQGSSSQLKRRWNDDVVFKGQARTEPETKKRFVNDTIRNDFHRRFLTKYIK
ncbi:unnamed protein product [Ascophyllum nodosum]